MSEKAVGISKSEESYIVKRAFQLFCKWVENKF